MRRTDRIETGFLQDTDPAFFCIRISCRADDSVVVMNAGAAIYIGGKAKNMEEGVKKAAELIDNGAAMKVLNGLIRESNE